MTSHGPNRYIWAEEQATSCVVCTQSAGSRCRITVGPRAGQVTQSWPHWVRVEQARGRDHLANISLSATLGALVSSQVRARGKYTARHRAPVP